jgi:hypothetical protein
MRIHRVRLQNYRGVIDSTVSFVADGVTVVEGPNEVGKTCIPEALDLLIALPDNSRARKVRDVKPVHRDAGPEVEIELSSGPYRFRYSKRWLRRPETKLAILTPSPRNLTGRDAHDRVEAMLEETLDAELWRALRVEQGTELAVPHLAVPSLGRALDRAAAGELSGSREDDLWERIAAERDRYWTSTGRPLKDRVDSERAVAAAEAEVDRLAAELAEIDRDAAEVARLDADEARLVAMQESSERALGDLSDRWEAVERLRSEIERLTVVRRAAEDHRERADGELQRRRQQSEDSEARRAELRALEAEAERAAPALAAAISENERADDALERSRAALAVAESRKARAGEDRDHHRNRIELAQLGERHERVVAAQVALDAAEAHLESAVVDDELLARIEEAHLAVVRAGAAATAAAASVETTALCDLTVHVGGEDMALRAGAAHTTAVEAEAEIRVPDVVAVRVRAGGDSRSLAAALAEARAELGRLCAEGGVGDVAEAQQAAEARRAAQRDRSDARRAIEQDLRDLTVEALAEKVARLGRRIDRYSAERPSDPPAPADFEEAKRLAAEADRAAGERVVERTRCEAFAEQAGAVRREAELAEANLAGRIDIARSARDRAAAALAAAREGRDDAALEADLLSGQQALDAATDDLRQVTETLEAADPVSLEQLLGNARDALERAGRDLQANRDDRQRLRISLELRGEQGLAESHDEARSRLGHLSAVHERTEARAEAARLLHDTFEARRAEARRRYAAPFKQRVERFGRIVFGSTFEVEVDDGLRVVRRTLDGVTLDIEQLSVGAREQIGVLARLACAAIVSPDGGGAPVVLDDALGWSDPSRLERMGAAIAAAGRECQVIVLTCTPGRYAHVGNARVVTLAN